VGYEFGYTVGYDQNSCLGAEKKALTDAAIRARKPATKPYKMYDREGLFLLVNPSGSKLWRWRYRAHGKEQLMALGEYPTVNLAEARERHFTAREKLAGGIDPVVERKAKAATRQREAEKRERETENSFSHASGTGPRTDNGGRPSAR
jgi:hypothetical protein